MRQDIASERLPDWMTRAQVTPLAIDWARLEQEGAAWMQYWDENIKGRGAEWLAERGLE